MCSQSRAPGSILFVSGYVGKWICYGMTHYPGGIGSSQQDENIYLTHMVTVSGDKQYLGHQDSTLRLGKLWRGGAGFF